MTSWRPYFPFPEVRPSQEESLNFIMNNIKNKRFLIIEAATGTGKSGIAIALSKWIQNNFKSSGHIKGSYIVTTQKILQQQYVDTFSDISNIWSKSNYSCAHRKAVSCEEGQLLAKLFSNTKESERCEHSCIYTLARRKFFKNPVNVTNIAYMLNQIEYKKPETEPKKRQLLVIDECHNLEQSIVDFVGFRVSRSHCEDELKIEPKNKKKKQIKSTICYPENFEDINVIRRWVEKIYMPAIKKKIDHIEELLSKVNPKSSEAKQLTKQYFKLNKQMCKNNRFLDRFDPEDWVITSMEDSFEIKPIHASRFAEEAIFNIGDKILLMSGTILNHKTFCQNNGIPIEDSCFISLDSPFPIENRRTCIISVASMSYRNITKSLPIMSVAVQKLLHQHKGEKGIIHTHTYRIANFLHNKDKTKRLLLHNPKNRTDILDSHLNSGEDSVLVSPSFTEGIDLINDTSRFQIVCKIPYPFLQDNYIRAKMDRCKFWYEWQTTKTIIQCLGRSIRSKEDYAISYILDADWERFYHYNKFMFPKWFKDALLFV